MDTKQENPENVLPEAIIPIDGSSVSAENSSDGKTNLNYDFNFENQIAQSGAANIPQGEEIKTVSNVGVADPAIGKVNPNPVMPENIVPIDIDTAAGATGVKKSEVSAVVPVIQESIKTSGTATEEEIVIDATKQNAEVLDEFAITMDANAEKVRVKKNNIFIAVVFGVIILFILLLKVIIGIVGY